MSDTQERYDQQGAPGAAPWNQEHPPSGASGAQPRRGYREDFDAFDPRRKSARTAALLSVAPGLGQAYIGYYKRGFVLAGIVFMLITLVNIAGRDLGGASLWALFFTWLFGIIDAGRMAALYTYAVAGGEDIAIPQDFKAPRLEGSVLVGIILTIFGAVMLSNTLFDISLYWIRDWWPIFPLTLGLYLVGRAIYDYVAVNRERTMRGEPMGLGGE